MPTKNFRKVISVSFNAAELTKFERLKEQLVRDAGLVDQAIINQLTDSELIKLCLDLLAKAGTAENGNGK